MYVLWNIKSVYIRNGFLPILSPRETVSELGVGKLVQTSSCRHAEVAPDVLIAAKIELLYRSWTWFETLQEIQAHICISYERDRL